MAENQTNLEATAEQDNNNESSPHTGREGTHLHTRMHTLNRLIYWIADIGSLCSGWSQFSYKLLQNCCKPKATLLHITVEYHRFDLRLHNVFRLLTTIISRNDNNTFRNINLPLIHFLATPSSDKVWVQSLKRERPEVCGMCLNCCDVFSEIACQSNSVGLDILLMSTSNWCSFFVISSMMVICARANHPSLIFIPNNFQTQMFL